MCLTCHSVATPTYMELVIRISFELANKQNLLPGLK
jgi:hypothetical protein